MEDGKAESDIDNGIEKEKVVASFTWLLNKAFTGNIPKLYSHILLEDNSGGWYVHPQLMRALVSGELYSTACANLFDIESTWSDHESVLRNLRDLGFEAIDALSGQLVDAASLRLDAPFHTDQHLTTIDCIMFAHICNIVTRERVDKALKNFCGSSVPIREREGEQLCETAVITWLQVAVACSLKQHTIYDSRPWLQSQILDSEMEDEDAFMASISLSNQIALLLNFYSPDLAPIDDFELEFSSESGHLPQSNSIHNAFVVKDFCHTQLPSPTPWYLPWPTKDTKTDAYEEGMHFITSVPPYPPDPMAVNFCSLLADLFYWLEISQSFRPSYKVYRTYDNKASNGIPLAGDVNFKIAKKLNTASPLGMSSRSSGARSTYRLPKSARPALLIDDINSS